ncbi:MAG: cell wall-binding repeat-containing protein [Coriobacteriia bacterium]|nr:cell wall-binding repeat-containing protein [Coriobacteriia bacterium]
MSQVALVFLALACSWALIAVQPASGATWPDGSPKVSMARQRVFGDTRFSTAVAITREAFDPAGDRSWPNVSHVVVASGDDRAASDPLAAASLCWAYEAPLLLVSASKTPAEVRVALTEMVSANTTVTVHVIGGRTSVPLSRIKELKAIVGSGRVEQPWASGSRYALARGIALRSRQVASESTRTVPSAAFIANGADSDTFFDALSLSAVSASTGIPILLAARDSVPYETADALRRLSPGQRIVAGGKNTVSAATYKALGANARWAGQNRYSTSAYVARSAAYRGWLDTTSAGLVGALPDAATGSVLAGKQHSPILVTSKRTLSSETAAYLADGALSVASCTVLGGPNSVSGQVYRELGGAPGLVTFTLPGGSLVAKKARITGQVGVNTTSVSFYADGRLVGTKAVKPFSSVDFGTVGMPSKKGTIKAVATNTDGLKTAASKTVRRLSYPASTSIVIDKSDFRLYWVRNDVLVKAYPIAIGRPSMETPVREWKVLAKYHTSPSGVYGPRKMRLFKRSGSGWAFTAYNVHGTNQPWVIGTKASHGCIRLYNKDILDLFPRVPLGTRVTTRE